MDLRDSQFYSQTTQSFKLPLVVQKWSEDEVSKKKNSTWNENYFRNHIVLTM